MDVVFLHAPKGSKNAHLYVARSDGTGRRRIDDSDEEKQDPEASPDGSRIGYRSLARGDYSDTPVLVLDVDSGRTVNLTRRSGVRGFGPRGARMAACSPWRESGAPVKPRASG